MDKATGIAMKQKDKLAAKDLKQSKVKPEKLTHAEVQALISSANAKKTIDEAKRALLDIISQLETRLTETEKEIKDIKEKQKEKKQ